MKLGMQVGRLWPRPHCARWGPISPPRKKMGTSPQFLAHVCCGQTAGWIKIPLGMKVGISQATLCYMGIQLPQMGHSPQFSAHVYGGQTDGWSKMPHGTEAGHIVLDGNPAPSRKGHRSHPSLFGLCLLWPNGRSSQLLMSTCFVLFINIELLVSVLYFGVEVQI